MTQSIGAMSKVDLKIVLKEKEREVKEKKEIERGEVLQRYNHEWL